MLAISRRPGQAIFVFPTEGIDPNMTVAELFEGGPIKIMTDIKNGQVKVGIAAPKDLTVLREELVGKDSGRVNGLSPGGRQKKPARVNAELGIEGRAGETHEDFDRRKTLIR